jgi:hypothetical protein
MFTLLTALYAWIFFAKCGKRLEGAEMAGVFAISMDFTVTFTLLCLLFKR